MLGYVMFLCLLCALCVAKGGGHVIGPRGLWRQLPLCAFVPWAADVVENFMYVCMYACMCALRAACALRPPRRPRPWCLLLARLSILDHGFVVAVCCVLLLSLAFCLSLVTVMLECFRRKGVCVIMRILICLPMLPAGWLVHVRCCPCAPPCMHACVCGACACGCT